MTSGSHTHLCTHCQLELWHGLPTEARLALGSEGQLTCRSLTVEKGVYQGVGSPFCTSEAMLRLMTTQNATLKGSLQSVVHNPNPTNQSLTESLQVLKKNLIRKVGNKGDGKACDAKQVISRKPEINLSRMLPNHLTAKA